MRIGYAPKGYSLSGNTDDHTLSGLTYDKIYSGSEKILVEKCERVKRITALLISPRAQI